MLSDRKFGSGAVETSLVHEGESRGDDVKAYYCQSARCKMQLTLE